MAGGTKLNHRQEAAVAALLSEKTLAEAALNVGVSERTLGNWLKDPAFQALYAQARLGVLERTTARLLAAQGKAVEALERNVACGQPAPENRAAELLLTHGRAGVEQLDLARQLAELRREIEEMRRHGHGHTAAGDHPAEGEADGAAAAGAAAAAEAGPPGPGPADGPGGDDAGPVADGPAPLFA